MICLSAVVCLVLLATVTATEVRPCPGRSADGLSESVTLIPCKRTPCRLKKGTEQHIKVEFTPERQISELKNHVTADVFGVTLPFVGVDGNSICDKIFTESGEKATCPLQSGTKYIYKDSFPILEFYPNLDLKVHWALQDGKKDIVCFEVPARISS